ncbi:putative glycosyltransferase, TIGR04372 family [Roseospirillum parvum]|uniref:Putative glycosyltransferase, TIGR04372 family n=2 Tax=Roseospirillum parvum TaxID=83401 RepID=A0A1G7TTU9_9PROT|nr:putative glycosyltransferase, TIGR04372 family [Roseospirillum parvum]
MAKTPAVGDLAYELLGLAAQKALEPNLATFALLDIDTYHKAALLTLCPFIDYLVVAKPTASLTLFQSAFWHEGTPPGPWAERLRTLDRVLLMETLERLDIRLRDLAERTASPALFDVPDLERPKLWKTLSDAGLEPDRWFVTLHVRQNAYRPLPGGIAHRSIEHLERYEALVHHIIDHQGGQVVLLGDPGMRFPPTLERPGVVPLYRHADSFLAQMLALSACRYMVNTESGPNILGLGYDVPMAMTNYVSLLPIEWAEHHLFLTKRMALGSQWVCDREALDIGLLRRVPDKEVIKLFRRGVIRLDERDASELIAAADWMHRRTAGLKTGKPRPSLFNPDAPPIGQKRQARPTDYRFLGDALAAEKTDKGVAMPTVRSLPDPLAWQAIGEAHQRLVICATQSSGSKMLCNMLKASGVAGAPEEHLYWWIREKTSLQEAVENGTQDGVFGVKVMASYVSMLSRRLGEIGVPCTGGDPFFSIFQNSAWIYLLRRDSLRQAISRFTNRISRAKDIDLYDFSSKDRAVTFDHPTIYAIIHFELDLERLFWDLWFRRHGIAPVVLVYEDICREPALIEQAMVRLGLPATTLPAPETRLESSPLNDWFHDLYRAVEALKDTPPATPAAARAALEATLEAPPRDLPADLIARDLEAAAANLMDHKRRWASPQRPWSFFMADFVPALAELMAWAQTPSRS